MSKRRTGVCLTSDYAAGQSGQPSGSYFITKSTGKRPYTRILCGIKLAITAFPVMQNSPERIRFDQKVCLFYCGDHYRLWSHVQGEHGTGKKNAF